MFFPSFFFLFNICVCHFVVFTNDERYHHHHHHLCAGRLSSCPCTGPCGCSPCQYQWILIENRQFCLQIYPRVYGSLAAIKTSGGAASPPRRPSSGLDLSLAAGGKQRAVVVGDLRRSLVARFSAGGGRAGLHAGPAAVPGDEASQPPPAVHSPPPPPTPSSSYGRFRQADQRTQRTYLTTVYDI